MSDDIQKMRREYMEHHNKMMDYFKNMEQMFKDNQAKVQSPPPRNTDNDEGVIYIRDKS